MPALEVTTDWTPALVNPDADNTVVSATTAVPAPDAPTFGDFLDIINPLHHIPIIGDIYRAITDDTIAPAARMVGGSIYGGVLGLLAAVLNVAAEKASGQDIGGNLMALFSDGEPRSSQLALDENPHAAGAASGQSMHSKGFASQPGTWYAALEQGSANDGKEIWGGP